ncbi:5-methylcytosine-specific restriction endonuclease McrA [Kribbella aluminosa]|uniref:5-methylcytosine-specific restriction endonuclease McrA n=1 Tax=Kribbella aluminosa TaxID=416017 RepID=A0ABS4UMP2_9ACTN|nr:HNH endonuclease family protein [Kribbella aluminosa]MBP2352922.1 5-methylcytosine-specific restriction endonuclease McrA [Kribbella aluminosa]
MTTLVTTVAAAATAWALTAGPVMASPPTPPSASAAATELASLTVKAEGSTTGYSRDKFPHWINQSGTCDTREEVLKRDGTGVKVDSSCQPTSGSWYSVYDKQTFTNSSDVDIDHIVPLAEAWKSGASGWTQAKRQEFANNLTISQLIAVSASSNRSKGDRDPSAWQPTNTAVHCLYARYWIWVKYTYSLSLQSTEKTALQQMLGTC